MHRMEWPVCMRWSMMSINSETICSYVFLTHNLREYANILFVTSHAHLDVMNRSWLLLHPLVPRLIIPFILMNSVNERASLIIKINIKFLKDKLFYVLKSADCFLIASALIDRELRRFVRILWFYKFFDCFRTIPHVN